MISTKLSLVLENPAIPSLSARNIRLVGPDPKEKVAAPFLAKLVLVRTAAMPVCVSADTVPSSLRLVAVTAVGPSRLSVLIVKSVIRSNEASLESARAKRKVSAPARPVRVSAPAPPTRTFAAALPLRVLMDPLPVALTALEPVRVMFSRFASAAIE